MRGWGGKTLVLFAGNFGQRNERDMGLSWPKLRRLSTSVILNTEFLGLYSEDAGNTSI